MKIGVFFGGSSSEKEVSLEGGRNVYQRIDRAQHEVVPIFIDEQFRFWQLPEKLVVQNTTADISARVESEAIRIFYEDVPKVMDFAYITGHGKYIEDGCLTGLMEMLGVPCTGSGVLGMALSMDKAYQRVLLRQADIDVPTSIVVSKNDWSAAEAVLQQIAQHVGYPCIIKPTREGCSTAITKCINKEDIAAGLAAAYVYDNTALVEEFLDGREITISVLGNDVKQALPITETPKHIGVDYLTLHDKFLPGGAEMITPAKLPPGMTERAHKIAERVCTVLELVGYPRIDMIVVGERIVVLEPNALPGITPSTMVFHQAAEIGLSPSQYLDRIIALALEAHQNKVGPL